MEIDLHGMELQEAMLEISYALKECETQEDHYLTIVHGYRGSGILKSYFSSRRFRRDVKRDGYKLEYVKDKNPGSSKFIVNFL